MEFKVSSEACLAEIAKYFAMSVKPPLTAALIGELGTGKTTFTRYVVQALGGTSPVSSPSFVLQIEYAFPGGVIEHWDLYRLTDYPAELREPSAGNVIRIIEWANRAPDFKKRSDIQVYFYFSGEAGERLVRIEGSGIGDFNTAGF